tara:strand:+ start:3133 stop:3345 length:213 start_codon:yes stop_codon:yes gene_type:complete
MDDEYNVLRGDIDYENNTRKCATWIMIDENDEYGWGWICYSDDMGVVYKTDMKKPVKMLKEELKLLLEDE